MKKTLSIALSALMAITIISCEKENEKNLQQKEQEARSAAILDSLKTRGILNALCRIDTLDNGEIDYAPRIGTALEPSTPTIFYSIAYDLDYARSVFCGIISSLNTNSRENLSVDEIRQGNIHLTFSESNESGEIAKIAVDCPDLKDDLTEIVFVKEERWPDNNTYSPFNLLSIWKYENRYYVCVKKADSGEGIMLSFDQGNGWATENFDEYTYYQGKFSLYKYTASSEAFYNWAYLMTYKADEYNRMLNNLGERGSNKWRDMFRNGGEITFNRDYEVTHGLWWIIHSCYYVTLNKTTVYCHKDKGGWQFGSSDYYDYYEHTVAPVNAEPSTEIRFSPVQGGQFNYTGWECIYKTN